MSFFHSGNGMHMAARYVPHSDVTRSHYERLLQDVRRYLPPGVDDDVEEMSERVLGIICMAHSASTTAQSLTEVQQRLEQLLNTRLSREARDHLLQYGKLITDYVALGEEEGGEEAGQAGAYGAAITGALGVADLNFAGPSSSGSDSKNSDDDSDTEERRHIGFLTGPASGTHLTAAERKERRRRRKALLAADENLVPYAFGNDSGPGDGTADGAEGWHADGAAAEEAEIEGEDEDVEGGLAEPKIGFSEVACNAQYVQDAIRRLYPTHDLDTCKGLAQRVLDFLAQKEEDDFTLETQLTTCLGGYEDEAVMDWIGDAVQSRWSIVYGLRYAQCTAQKARRAVMDEMRAHALEDARVEHLYQSITGKEVDPLHTEQAQPRLHGEEGEHGAGTGDGPSAQAARQPPLRRIDLQACAFQDERTPHLHVRATVPQGTQRLTYETHDEVILPPTSHYNTTTPLVLVATSFPSWAVPAFPGVTELNAMQSTVFDSAFHSDENMLVSAPTGAGKTNVAMMAMLRAVEKCRNSTTGVIDGENLKMVYVAPMKALVQEVVRTFSKRLEPLGLTVAELSGDAAMTQQQMATTQLIVTTPEKWDIVTRKSVELGVASLLKLLILDEVHLLHNERGPVLEAIVARTMLQQQLRGEGGIRLVGLSATLPNYADVASFLQVDRQRGLFVFDSSFRPIPLEQTYCAVKKIKGSAQSAVLNLVTYDKVLQTVQVEEQVMIFVHSRRETEYTARYLQKRAAEERRGYYFVQPESASQVALQEASTGAVLRRSLQQLLPDGFGIHHAGLSREERSTVEQLFADRHLKVLVCTSTLAWGVNLPANRVIIKGTRVFNGAKGQTELLSALDVLQMFGRAGRVGFGAAVGRAAIITAPEDLHYYLSVLNQQLPIESQMMKKVVDMLNAEITLGHVETIEEGVQWLQRSYLYVRMRQVPEVYGIRPSTSDPLLLHHLANIVHTACDELKGAKMADYDARVRRVSGTAYGRIASYCYLTTASMTAYLSQMSNAMQEVELFRVFASSSEFANIGVRAEEQAQLKELLECAPVAVQESRYTPLAKINILLQCYISQKDLEGLPLMSEMVYVKDSAQRILRALYEICLIREYGRTARQFLELYCMTVHRQWVVQSPLRQVRALLPPKHFEAILPALERVRVPWEEMRSWSVEDLAERLSDDRRAQSAYDAIHAVPHYAIEAAVRPLTRGMLYVDVDILPDFDYNEALHGRTACEVLLMIEHTNGRLLHHEAVQLPLINVQQREGFACPPVVVPMMDPAPTHLFVRVVSPNWLGATATASVCLLNTLLPPVAAPLREVDQRPPSKDAAAASCAVAERLAEFQLHTVGEQLFPFTDFTALQSDLIQPIFHDHPHNLLVGVPPGGGKTVIAELFVLQFLLEEAMKETERAAQQQHPQQQSESDAPSQKGAMSSPSALRPGKVLYVTSHPDVVHRRALDWRYKFGVVLKQGVTEVSGEDINDESTTDGEVEAQPVSDLNLPDAETAISWRSATILLVTGERLLRLIRRGDPVLRGVTHIVADHLHLLRAPEGQAMEECLARLNAEPFLVRHGVGRARVLGLTYPLISTAELGRWMKVSTSHQYNYGPSYRQLRVRMAGLELPGPRSRYESGVVAALKQLRRPSYAAATTVVFVPTARQAKDVAQRVLLRCRDNVIPESTPYATDDPRLALYLAAGVAYMHRGTSELDSLTVQEMVESPALHPETQTVLPLILVCTFDAAWRLPAALVTNAIVCAAERLTALSNEDGERGMTYKDCSAVELMQMASRAMNEAVVHCRSSRMWVWAKLLNEPLPLESSLRYADDFRDTVNAAIAQGRAKTRVDVLRVLSSHYFLHHVKSNLHFYGVPTAADVALYASSFASHVVHALKALGCVEELRLRHGSDSDDQDLHTRAEEDVAEEAEDEEEDPHAPLRPTVRGMALAHHCIAVGTAEDLLRAFPDDSAGQKTKLAAMHRDGTAALWKMIAAHCAELTPAHLGDAARVMDVAEHRALHSLARALPESVNVRYIDLDFSAAWIKVYLLMLAYCCRLLPAAYFTGDGSAVEQAPAEASGSSAFDAHHNHVFHTAAAPPAQRAVLCESVPADVAERMVADARVLLPSARRVVAAVVELVDGDTQAWIARRLMDLASGLEQQLWVPSEEERENGEGGIAAGVALLQLSCWRAPCWSDPTKLAALQKTCTLTALQENPEAAVAQLEPCVRAALGTASDTTVPIKAAPSLEAVAEARVRQTLTCAVQAAAAVPRIVAVSAKGRVEEVQGSLAMIVSIEATLQWTPLSMMATSAPSVVHTPLAALPLTQWWLRCVMQRKEASAAVRQLALRVRALTAADAVPRESSRFTMSSEVFFPLSRIESEDLDAVEMRAVVTSVGYCGVEGHAVVHFDSEEE